MFTGLVEAVGVVRAMERGAGGARLVLEVPFGDELAPGESVAVDGCCLTQLPDSRPMFAADLALETLSRTNLEVREPGDRVNLERALRTGDRLGGHVVQGHVDGVERLLAVEQEGDGVRQRFSLSEDAAAFVVPKGSIALNGVSLTIADLGPGWMEVALIPHTLEWTNLGDLGAGDPVNVEHDLVGKHVLRALGLSGRVELGPEASRRLGLT